MKTFRKKLILLLLSKSFFDWLVVVRLITHTHRKRHGDEFEMRILKKNLKPFAVEEASVVKILFGTNFKNKFRVGKIGSKIRAKAFRRDSLGQNSSIFSSD